MHYVLYLDMLYVISTYFELKLLCYEMRERMKIFIETGQETLYPTEESTQIVAFYIFNVFLSFTGLYFEFFY